MAHVVIGVYLCCPKVSLDDYPLHNLSEDSPILERRDPVYVSASMSRRQTFEELDLEIEQVH